MKRNRRVGLAGLGLEFAGAVAGLALVGFWIDRSLQTAPWGTLVGSLVGLVGGTYNFVRASLRSARRAEAERAQQGGTERDGR